MVFTYSPVPRKNEQMAKYTIPPGVAAATELVPCQDKNILFANREIVREAVARINGTAIRRTSRYPPACSLAELRGTRPDAVDSISEPAVGSWD
jgi:hypothetical protein